MILLLRKVGCIAATSFTFTMCTRETFMNISRSSSAARLVSEGKFGVAPGEHVAFYDIFRFENGKIVEHWDNIQTIPADGEWANPNGKFGF